jgi:hypothetical protein
MLCFVLTYCMVPHASQTWYHAVPFTHLGLCICMECLLILIAGSWCSLMFLCRVALLMYKHKTHVIDDDGSVLSNDDVDFYVADVSNSSFHWSGSETIPCTFSLCCVSNRMHFWVQDMVHIADTKVTKHFGDYFIQHISKACNFCLLWCFWL